MFPTEQLLEFAYAAYRINNGYVKSTVYHSANDTTTYPNKDIVLFSALKKFRPDDYIPSWFVMPEITDRDRENVKLALEHYKRYTLLLLGTDLSTFQKDVFAVISQDTVPVHKIGLVAVVPTVVKSEKAESVYLRKLKKDFSDSKHYVLKTSVSGTIEILKRIHLRDYSTYLYFAGLGENLISFTKPTEYSVGAVYELNGKVKSLEKERETGFNMTKLNYVKLNAVEVTNND